MKVMKLVTHPDASKTEQEESKEGSVEIKKFLDEYTHFHERLCPLVCWSVGPLVRWSVDPLVR